MVALIYLRKGQRKKNYQHRCQGSIERIFECLTIWHSCSVSALKDYSFPELIPGIYSISVNLLFYYFSQRLQVAHTPSMKCSYVSDKTARKRYKPIWCKSRRWREPNQEHCDKHWTVDMFQQFCFTYREQRLLVSQWVWSESHLHQINSTPCYLDWDKLFYI